MYVCIYVYVYVYKWCVVWLAHEPCASLLCVPQARLEAESLSAAAALGEAGEMRGQLLELRAEADRLRRDLQVRTPPTRARAAALAGLARS